MLHTGYLSINDGIIPIGSGIYDHAFATVKVSHRSPCKLRKGRN